MFEKLKSSKTHYLIEKSLNASIDRANVISNNIANADVPNFKRSEVIFESMLKRAMHSEKIEKEKAVPTQISHSRHMDFFTPLDYKKVKPKVNIDYLTTMRPDGGNVDVEKEAVDATKNQLRYNMMIELLNHNFRDLKIAMRIV